jgi:hypothetical protein
LHGATVRIKLLAILELKTAVPFTWSTTISILIGAGGAVMIGHCAFTLAARNTSRDATTGRRIVEILFMVNKLDDGKRERQYPEECG